MHLLNGVLELFFGQNPIAVRINLIEHLHRIDGVYGCHRTNDGCPAATAGGSQERSVQGGGQHCMRTRGEWSGYRWTIKKRGAVLFAMEAAAVVLYLLRVSFPTKN